MELPGVEKPQYSRHTSYGLVSLPFGKDQLRNVLTGAGVRERVTVGTTAAGGAVHDAGGAVVGEVVGQGWFRVPQMPAVFGRTYGGVVGDDEARERFCGPVLRAVADPKHVPTVAIRG